MTAAIPDEITQKVIDALQKHLAQMRTELDDQIHTTEEKVTQKLTGIDSSSKLAAVATTAKVAAVATKAKAK
jgi:hypothetical protein